MMENKELRENIQTEFEVLYRGDLRKMPEDADAVVVLSHVDYAFPSEDERRRYTKELVSRIDYGVELLKKTKTDTYFVMDGCDVQLPLMIKRAVDMGVSEAQIYTIDGGDIDSSNSKKQIEVLRDDPIVGRMKKIVLITNTYHVPRVLRTASKILPEEMSFDVFGVPNDAYLYDKQKMIDGEIERIVKYSTKGDIALVPR